MSAPRRNPVLAPNRATIPPARRSRVATEMSAWAAAGVFALQTCGECEAVQYPPRDVCRNCLSPRLRWRPADGAGALLATTRLHYPYELYFRERAPWRTGIVRLAAGVSVTAFLHPDLGEAPAPAFVTARLDRAGQAALIALPDETANFEVTPMREFTASPKGRKILVTDAASPAGIAMVKAMCAAGAATVWAGRAEPWGVVPGYEEAIAHPAVTVLPLDVTDGDSVTSLAGRIGGRTDIVVNTATYHRPGRALGAMGVESARAEMETTYFGLLRLARAFGPALAARAAEGPNHAVAFVNLFSITALVASPAKATHSAAEAAAYAFAQGMRADMRASGLRVVNVFPGPVDEGWNQLDLPPKIAPDALARATVKALETGVEDVFPDPVARQWYARWRDDPAAFARELAEAGA
ncbi:SDR family NAD(P)-dependent oxidoreductase [Acuticoccus sp. M5D2P5]|uniref:SDR family NAD(P)-dependent oxidoreductase n=1 Tax=Acuticoccus kalidii TaxID=2910977 RepID=UPI001F45F872|nr:SDR family NAD(P)-dependent oxidoreductase [Acuticoccus kalidii]MCF3935486.1 SDR family NAD(P)-dependent oxidoreductase [Acuticoccus kalidii]